MRALLLLFLSILLGANSAFAYDLVLPKEKRSIVNTNYAFFVGKANKTESITINDEKIYIAPNGAFAHSVKLKEGENRIMVKSNFNTQVYKFYKNSIEKPFKPEIIELEPKLYKVKKDNTPLRNTPVDFGMNRISHLFEGTYLLINGQKGRFYRVFLAKDNEAWIDKESVAETNEVIIPKFLTMNNERFKNASKHSIEFTEKLPYTISETKDEIIFKVYDPLTSNNSIYTINIPKPEKYTYKTSLDKGTYIFKVSELLKPKTQTLDGLVITIDAGHGGSEKGAIGCLGDKEKDINLKIANELKEILNQMGATTIMTRECDGNVSLEDRIKIAQENDTNIFVSIHLNSIPDIKFDIHKNRGTSVYHYNPNSKALAQSVEEALLNKINTRNDGIKTASFAVIRPTDYIGILVEVAYMTNPIDSMLYTQENFPRETAQGIAEGILNYINAE